MSLWKIEDPSCNRARTVYVLFTFFTYLLRNKFGIVLLLKPECVLIYVCRVLVMFPTVIQYNSLHNAENWFQNVTKTF